MPPPFDRRAARSSDRAYDDPTSAAIWAPSPSRFVRATETTARQSPISDRSRTARRREFFNQEDAYGADSYMFPNASSYSSAKNFFSALFKSLKLFFAGRPARRSDEPSNAPTTQPSKYRNSDADRACQVRAFTMEEIIASTKNFSKELKIGEGSFGTVYKGRLNDGTLVAVKRAKKGSYRPNAGIDFQSEIKILRLVEHHNLVRFYGYLECNEERVIVVEYVPNGTLRKHLDGKDGKFLSFAARLEIAIDVAHAVTYLHMYAGHPIIHRDIKSANILLTESLRAKVADFGFARLGPETAGQTHVITQVKGTAGYLDPEYVRSFELTEKSDVYSFGVLLVEIVSSRHPIERKRPLEERLTRIWAMKRYANGEIRETLDPRLEQNMANLSALEKILELASQCMRPNRDGRPNMRACVEILWNIRKDYTQALFFESTSSQSQPF